MGLSIKQRFAIVLGSGRVVAELEDAVVFVDFCLLGSGFGVSLVKLSQLLVDFTHIMFICLHGLVQSLTYEY